VPDHGEKSGSQILPSGDTEGPRSDEGLDAEIPEAIASNEIGVAQGYFANDKVGETMPVEHKIPDYQVKAFPGNKSFTVRRIEVEKAEGLVEDVVRVKLWSRTKGKDPPFYLMGKRENVRNMVHNLLVLLNL
jgi:hypothetical protein